MDNKIELYDEKRLLYLKWYVIGFSLFMGLMLTRYFFRMDGLNDQPIGKIVLLGLIVTFLIQLICVILAALLQKDIMKDPHLEAALNNEFIKAITTQSWIAAYIGSASMNLFFAIIWSFYPICDPVSISLSSIAMGAGAYQIYFYIKYKNS